MDTLIKHAASFIKVFDGSKDRMREIVGEFEKTAAEVKNMQEMKNTQRSLTVAATGIGIVAGFFTGGLSLVVGAVAIAGGGAIGYTNVTKSRRENEKAKEVEELGK